MSLFRAGVLERAKQNIRQCIDHTVTCHLTYCLAKAIGLLGFPMSFESSTNGNGISGVVILVTMCRDQSNIVLQLEST